MRHLDITPHRSWSCFSFFFFPPLTDCLSLPPGSAGKGGKSTEAAALLREEAAQQRARDWREGNAVALFPLHLSVFHARQAFTREAGCLLLKLICSSPLTLHHSRCPQPFRHTSRQSKTSIWVLLINHATLFFFFFGIESLRWPFRDSPLLPHHLVSPHPLSCHPY